jgi:CRISPR-associated protein Csm1
MESTLCPKGKYQEYTHKHVLFTHAFFDLIKERAALFPDGIFLDRVSEVASFHHQPDNAPFPAVAWLCTLGDRYSAGMDRKSEEESDLEKKSREAYRRLPLRCIFDEVALDPERGETSRHAYGLKILDPHSADALIPDQWKGEDPELPAAYRKIWTSFIEDFMALCGTQQVTSRLFEEALLGSLERTTWSIPSSTMDIPDISLYDHLRTSAAIAACLFRFHQARGDLADLSAIKNDSIDKFRFLAGDLSGIQNTLFTLKSQGVRGVNKILRARSFLLGAVAEAAALQALEAFDLPRSCLVQQAGGRFLILAPHLNNGGEILESLRKRFDAWLLENYTGSLALNLALSEPFSGQDFKAGRFQTNLLRIGHAVENAKHRPLQTCGQGVLKREFPLDRECSACGARPAQPAFKEDEEYRCSTCQRELTLGRRLTSMDFAIWAKNLDMIATPAHVLGLDLFLVRSKDLPSISQKIISIQCLRPEERKGPWAQRIIANYVPRFADKSALQNPRYKGIEAPESSDGAETIPKTFAHIGAEALEMDTDGRYRGKPFLALLKADVDYLGFIFSRGLKGADINRDRFTLSRLAQLSRMIDLYFTGYLQGLIRREFPDTYTVYAGGDDLLLIGPWRQSLDLTLRISETFCAYTGQNPNITISAGVSLLHPNHPVNRAVSEAEEFLELAKDARRNRICALMEKPLTWDRYRDRLEDARWINGQMTGKESVSNGFIYRILEIARDAEDVAHGDIRKAGWRSRLAYHLARNLKGKTDKEKKEKIANWLEKLGLDNLFQLSGEHPNIFDWRLPISIALYRNRR